MVWNIQNRSNVLRYSGQWLDQNKIPKFLGHYCGFVSNKMVMVLDSLTSVPAKLALSVCCLNYTDVTYSFLHDNTIL